MDEKDLEKFFKRGMNAQSAIDKLMGERLFKLSTVVRVLDIRFAELMRDNNSTDETFALSLGQLLNRIIMDLKSDCYASGDITEV